MLSETNINTISNQDLAAVAKALAHPARLAILNCLLESDTCITGDLSASIGLAQATTSQHLKELKKAGIIQGNIAGTATKYCINPQRWKEISALFQAFFATYQPTKCN